MCCQHRDYWGSQVGFFLEEELVQTGAGAGVGVEEEEDGLRLWFQSFAEREEAQGGACSKEDSGARDREELDSRKVAYQNFCPFTFHCAEGRRSLFLDALGTEGRT